MKIIEVKIIQKYQINLDPVMLISLIMRNIKLEIIEVEADQVQEKLLLE